MTLPAHLKIPLLTLLSLCAFAANSVLCRMALGEGYIDAASFTAIRLISGVVVLALIIGLRARQSLRQPAGSWISGLMLFSYALAFSYAYISLQTGTGALILFGSVQITMIFASFLAGIRLSPAEWLGMLLAFGGFFFLVIPGASAPSVSGLLLMTLAGVAWGIYTLRGRGSQTPLRDTAFNFFRCIPLTLVLLLFTWSGLELSRQGIILAMLSGGLASGIGYTLWYAALKGLSPVQAAVLQLSVPVIAALGGVVLVSEPITIRLVSSSLLILGGILLVILARLLKTERA